MRPAERSPAAAAETALRKSRPDLTACSTKLQRAASLKKVPSRLVFSGKKQDKQTDL